MATRMAEAMDRQETEASPSPSPPAARQSRKARTAGAMAQASQPKGPQAMLPIPLIRIQIPTMIQLMSEGRITNVRPARETPEQIQRRQQILEEARRESETSSPEQRLQELLDLAERGLSS